MLKMLSFLLLLLLFVGCQDIFNERSDECPSGEKSKCYPKGCVYYVESNEAKCQKCHEDYHCFDFPKYICGDDGKCKMRSVSNVELNISWYEAVSFVVCFFIVVVSTIGGVGGGIILVSSLLAIGQFHIKSISPMSSSLVFGASLCAVLMTILKKHPNPKVNRPIIDWDFVTTVEPIILSGTIIGVLFNSMFPAWLTLGILLIVVVVSFLKVTQKGRKMYKMENKERKEKEEERKLLEDETGASSTDVASSELDDLELGSTSATTDDTTEEEEEGGKKLSDSEEEEEEEEEPKKDEKLLKKLLWYDSIQIPIHKIFVLLFAWFVILALAFLKGSKRSPSVIGVAACSYPWWGIMIVAFPILFLMSYFYAFTMHWRHKMNVKAGFDYLPTDMKWDLKRTIFVPVIFILSGVIAALIGTGGGLINGPLMIALGYPPQIMTATNLLMIFITSSSGFTQFMVARKIPLDYALLMIVIGFFAAFVGRSSASAIVKKTGRRSAIVFILSALIVSAGFASLGVGVYKIYLAFKKGENMLFKSPC